MNNFISDQREPLSKAIKRYREEIQIYRSDEFLAHMAQLSESELVGNALMERLEPQFHLMQNATELRAQPLLALEQHAYYFKLLASLKEDALEEKQIISAESLLIPHLVPLLPIAQLLPVAPVVLIGGHYVQTKLEERREKRNLAHSLLGILAGAKDAPDDVE